VYPHHQVLNSWTNLYETYHGIWAHLNGVLHKSLPSSLCVCMYILPIVARQRMGKNVTAATNTHTTIEELLDASLSMLSVSYQRKVSEQFFPELFVFNINIWLSFTF
jgi:hypothetical protein